MLFDGAGEEEWTKWVKARARKYVWHGVHVRYSQAVMESIHTLRKDQFSEAYGMPDWLFWHEDRGEAFLAELKGATGSLRSEQKLEIASLRRGGLVVFVWYPRHMDEVDHIFEHGLGEQACLKCG